MMDIISFVCRQGFIISAFFGLLGGTLIAGVLIYLFRLLIGISVLLYRGVRKIMTR